jgi:hypothetical protein
LTNISRRESLFAEGAKAKGSVAFGKTPTGVIQ